MKKVIYTFFICLFVALTTITILFYTNTRISFGFLAIPASKLLTYITKTQVEIRGNYSVTLGEWVIFTIDNGSLLTADQNVPKISAEIEYFQSVIHLSSLLKKQLLLDGINLRGGRLELHLEGESFVTGNLKQGEDSPLSSLASFVPQSTGEITIHDLEATIFYAEDSLPVLYQFKKGTGLFGTESEGRFEISGQVDAIELKADIITGPFGELFGASTPWPFSMNFSHKSIAASISGFGQLKDDKPIEIEATFKLEGEHLDDLVSLFGREGSRNKPFSVTGRTGMKGESAWLELAAEAPGIKKFAITGLAAKQGVEGTHYSLKVKSQDLNLDVLKGFLSSHKSRKEVQNDIKTAYKIGKDDILLPERFPVSNLDIDLEVKQLIIMGKSIKDLTLKAIVDDGSIDEAPFTAIFKTSSLVGHFSFQEAGSLPLIKTRLNSRSFNIGAFLKEFKFAENIEMQIAEVSTDLSTKGRTLGELADNLTFTSTSKGGIYVFEDSNTGARLPIQLHQSTISLIPGDGLQVHLIGEVRSSPVDIELQFENYRAKSGKGIEDVSFSSVITLAGGRIKLDGNVPVPIKKEGVMLSSQLSCKQLSGFNDLLGLELPEVGPLTMAGTLHVVPNGYRLQKMLVNVGTSSLTGEIEVDTISEPPELTVNIQANTIQLDDFKFERKQPENVLQIPGQQKDTQKVDKKKKKKVTNQKVIESYNSKINIQVGDVFSGKDHLGRGNLTIEQQGGTFKVMPLHLNLPGGSVTLSLSVEPADDETRRYVINMEIRDLDYGTVGRWFKPDTDLKGILHLRSSLTSNSPDFKNIMAEATGYIDFSIQPEKLRSGVIDLWAVNFFTYLVPYLTPKNESVINCAAARFSVEDGILHDEDLLIDTTRIQVKGKVGVDFNKKWIDALFKSEPKRPQFFSLTTPVKVSGELSKFKGSVPPGGVLGTVIRNVVSVVTVPLQWIFKKKVPKDGTANCTQLFEARSFDSRNQSHELNGKTPIEQ